jgi:hypothetical protein
MVTLFRVQQIEARLRELAGQDAALRLSTRLAAAQISRISCSTPWPRCSTGWTRATPAPRRCCATSRLPARHAAHVRARAAALADEMEMVRRYLAIMQARLGARLRRASTCRPTRPPSCPGIVLTLVENAIAHGIEPQLRGGRVEVAARREGELLVVTVRDDGPGLAPGWTGRGPVQHRRRSAALPHATLTLTDAAPGCRPLTL